MTGRDLSLVIPLKMEHPESPYENNENIIDINTADTVLNVPSEHSTPNMENAKASEVPSVFSTRKRIIVGSALLVLLIAPILVGSYLSFMYRQKLYEPVDSDNIWPETEYTGTVRKRVKIYKDPGYSEASNYLLHIPNGKEDVFEVKDYVYGPKTNPPKYVSAFLLENLFGDSKKYGIHLVTNTRNSEMRALKSINKVTDAYSLLERDDKSSLGTGKNYRTYYSPSDTSQIAIFGQDLTYLVSKIDPSKFSFSDDQDQVIKVMAEAIQTAIDNQANLYSNIKERTEIFTLPDYSQCMEIPIIEHLQKLRKKDLKAAKSSSTAIKPKPRKPQFKRIKIRDLDALKTTPATGSNAPKPHRKR